jgi:hypothetical protein
MNLQPQNYKNLHDFLDALFEGQDPSNESVVLAKNQYWKAYNLKLIQKRRKQNHEFSVSFSKAEFKLVKERMIAKQAVSQYIRQVVLDDLYDDTSTNHVIDTAIIEQQLFLVAEYLRDLLENERTINESAITHLQSQILELQNLIENQFDR